MRNGDMPANPCSVMDHDLAQALKDGREQNGLSVQEIRRLSACGGLTKREHFAAMAMQGFCALDGASTPEQTAYVAVRYADALLAELEKPQ